MRFLQMLLWLSLTAISLSASRAASGDRETLDMIDSFSTKFCGEYFRSGSRNTFDMSGKARVEISEFFKKLVDAGVDGDAELASQEYFNVLRGDLAQELSSIRTCKLKLWDDLKYKAERDDLSAGVSSQSDATRTKDELILQPATMKKMDFSVNFFGCKRPSKDIVECSLLVTNKSTKEEEIGINSRFSGLSTPDFDIYRPSSLKKSGGKWEGSDSEVMKGLSPGAQSKYYMKFKVSPGEESFAHLDIGLAIRWVAKKDRPVFRFEAK